MLCSVENSVEITEDESFGKSILEQHFSLLSAEGRTHLRDYLKNLVSMQDTMAGAYSTDEAHSLPKNKRGLC